MAGTVTITEEVWGTIKKIKFAWTSTAGGAASDTTDEVYSGKVLLLVTVPDGTDAPTDNYDITVTDEDSVDVLCGAGANRDTADTEYVQESSLGVMGNSKLTLNVSAAGNAKKGEVYLFIR
jgi:hypothetical protein